jgi:CheY-like chemotaxis protein
MEGLNQPYVTHKTMAQITIEIPDELLPQLEPLQNQLPAMIAQWLTPTRKSGHLAYQEVLDFFLTQPGPAEILSFKVSAVTQNRLSDLLNQNRESTLSDREMAELDGYEQLDQLMQILKISAHKTLNLAVV